jgi:hypothetical protein
MKPRSDSRLFKLSLEQQAQLYDWIHKLGYVKAKKLAAQPLPEGFGVKTHLNSLCRFVARYTEMQKEREFFDIVRCASGELHPQALRAAETRAHEMAYEIASGPGFELDKFRLITRWLMKAKDEQQAEAWRKIVCERPALVDAHAALILEKSAATMRNPLINAF